MCAPVLLTIQKKITIRNYPHLVLPKCIRTRYS